MVTGFYVRAGDPGVRGTRPHSGVAGVSTVPLAGAGQIIEDQSPASVTNMQHAAVSHVGGGTENWRLAGHTGLRLSARGWGHLLSHAPCHNITITIVIIVR